MTLRRTWGLGLGWQGECLSNQSMVARGLGLRDWGRSRRVEGW